MKQYVIDELRYPDFEALRKYLDEYLEKSGVDGIYWLQLDPSLLSPLQREHAACQPHFFSLELTETSLQCELLVRSRPQLRCNCISYANETQRNWLIALVDAIFEKLQLKC